MIVTASGEIDLGTAGSLIQALRKALTVLAPSDDLVVDLAEVTFIDCAGLGPLLMARRRLKDRFWLLSPPAQVRRLLGLAGLADEFAVLEFSALEFSALEFSALEGLATMPRARDSTDRRPPATATRLVRQLSAAEPRRQLVGESADIVATRP